MLYSVWRDSDDRLLILDGTAAECGECLGIRRDSFYRLMKNPRSGYTIRKISSEQSKKESGR